MIQQEMNQNQNDSRNGKKQKWKPLALALICILCAIPTIFFGSWYAMEYLTHRHESPLSEEIRQPLDREFSKFKRKISGQRY